MWGEDILKNANAVVVYFAVLLVLVFLCVYHLRNMSKKPEHAYLGAGTQDSSTPFSSGATMRNLAQEFSSTNQGSYGIVHNDELKELVGSKERLVNERGMPDFWEISSELGAYRDEQAAAFRGDIAAEQAAQKTGAAAANAAAAAGAPPAAAAAAGQAAAAQAKKEYLSTNPSGRDQADLALMSAQLFGGLPAGAY